MAQKDGEIFGTFKLKSYNGNMKIGNDTITATIS